MTDSEVKGRTWFERDYPVLLATAAQLEESRSNMAMSHEIAARAGIEADQVVKALGNLGTRYVLTKDASSLGGRDLYAVGLTDKGLEAADVWPSSDLLAERLVAALERLLEETPEGSPKAGKLRAALDALRELTVGTAGNVLGQAVSTALGLA